MHLIFYFRLYLLYHAIITYIKYVSMMAKKSRCFHCLRKSALPFVPRFRRVRLLLVDSSTDPKLVFLDNGKLSMEINLAEPVEPFCKNQPNIYFGWRSR